MYRIILGPPKRFEEMVRVWKELTEKYKVTDFTLIEDKASDTWSIGWSLRELLRMPREFLERQCPSVIKVMEGPVVVASWRMGEDGETWLRSHYHEPYKFAFGQLEISWNTSEQKYRIERGYILEMEKEEMISRITGILENFGIKKEEIEIYGV